MPALLVAATALRLPSFELRAPQRRHWAPGAVLFLMAALYLVAGLSLTGVKAADGRAAARAPADMVAAIRAAPPRPEPVGYREVAPDDAVAINAAVPLSTLPNPAARPFVLRAATEADRIRSLECLTAAVYYEAASEGLDGQRAVAQVVLNRVRHPAYPNSICGVVFEGSERATGCQFTFTCDGALARAPHPGLWRQARQVAEAALAGKVFKPVGWATHYHTNWVVPYWSAELVKSAIVGTHIFYRWEGGWGRAPAFRTAHAGSEPALAKMRHLTSAPAPAPEESLVDAAAEESTGAPLGTVTIGDKERAVVRRYDPLDRARVASILSVQAKSGEENSALAWSLGGSETVEAPLGKKKPEAAAAKESAEAASPPIVLSGVRIRSETGTQ
jgi:spore germination cell wall hydrolase CwlJ-like protein